MKHKVAELEGPLLDFAVARARRLYTVWQEGESVVGRAVHANDVIGSPLGVVGATGDQRPYSPSTLWDQGGPIIEQQGIGVATPCSHPGAPGTWWDAEVSYDHDPSGASNRTAEGQGPTPLIAAMRAYVASKLGEEVDLP